MALTQWWLLAGLPLVLQPSQQEASPARAMPPVPMQAPTKEAPVIADGPGSARQRACRLTAQAIREALIKRFDPDYFYMKEWPDRNPDFRREVLNRAIFDTLAFSHGDKSVIREVLTELSAREYPWIDLRVASADVDWIAGEKSKWLGLVINQLAAAQLDANVPVTLAKVPLPRNILITTGSGTHRASLSFSSTDLPRLREEVQYLNNNVQGFDLSTQSVSDALRFTLESPPETDLRARLRNGEKLKPELFHARLWQAIFVNMDKIQGDSKLLSSALDGLVDDYPDVTRTKPRILSDLHDIKRHRIEWVDSFVLPKLWEFEHPKPRPGQVAVASPQNTPSIPVRLPKIAWVFKDPGPENIPQIDFSDFSARKAENDLLRSMP